MELEKRKGSRMVRAFLKLDRLHRKAYVLSRAVFVGAWLGVLSKKNIHAVDEAYYDSQTQYRTDRYNLKGLSNWERDVIDAFFAGRERLLVVAAGGGREVLALHNMGFRVDAFECHPDLVRYGNDFLKHQGAACTIRLVERDGVPDTAERFDGLVIGWGGFMLIQGRSRRIAFLKGMRQLGKADAPILLSFFDRVEETQRFRLVAAVANAIRRIRRASLVEVGDSLVPNYVHFFTKNEIAEELAEAGYRLAHYSREEYTHAVAVPADVPTERKKTSSRPVRTDREFVT